jgi:hypothetical protein
MTLMMEQTHYWPMEFTVVLGQQFEKCMNVLNTDDKISQLELR